MLSDVRVRLGVAILTHLWADGSIGVIIYQDCQMCKFNRIKSFIRVKEKNKVFTGLRK